VTNTAEQDHIIDRFLATSANLQIKALAGTGKTHMLGLIEAQTKVPTLCLAFNRKIADEMEARFTRCTVKTLNGLGHGIWNKAVGKLRLDTRKTQNLLSDRIQEMRGSAKAEVQEEFWSIVNGVSMAKALGHVPHRNLTVEPLIDADDFFDSLDEEPSILVRRWINEILTASIRAAYDGHIDYNDQLYMPALFGGTYPKFPLVLVDEAQDLSPINHEMLSKLAHGRIIAVGDPFQSIYGFRGADPRSMARLKERFEMEELDLSISFRCPSEIVKHVHWRVPHFKWSKVGGSVHKSLNLVPSEATIICRNNAPLFRLAFELLKGGHAIQVVGSDIGPKIIGIMERLGNSQMKGEALTKAIETWRTVRRQKKSKTADDMADAMLVFAERGGTLAGAVAQVKQIFAQQGTIKLMTGHKSKGLEFDTVYHLRPDLVGPEEQDLNLRYVISTRSRDRLYEVEA
jgi:DNA helicase-2/ATP-dependent DNA helicase PcrA